MNYDGGSKGVIEYTYVPGQPPPQPTRSTLDQFFDCYNAGLFGYQANAAALLALLPKARYKRCSYCARPHEGKQQCNGCGAWYE